MRLNFVAHQRADRYHRGVVALGGGAAIFVTLAVFLAGAIVFVKFFAVRLGSDLLGEAVMIHKAGFLDKVPQLIVILVCMSVLFAMGLYDDKKSLSPVFKLIVQFLVAFAAAFFADVRVELFIESRVITSALSAFWIVLIINAFNFLDNMDGLSAGTAVIAVCVLFTSAALAGQVFIGGMALLFIGALLGFLFFNFPPASIFMGDAGSMVIGFFIALLTLRITYYHEALSGKWYTVFMPLIVMAVPLYDFISVTLLRISQGKSPFVGDTQHFSHRLKSRGLTDTQTVLTLYLATFCTAVSSAFLNQVNLAAAILIFVQTVMILLIIAILETTAKNDNSRHEN